MTKKYLKVIIGSLALSIAGCGTILAPVKQRQQITYELTDKSIVIPVDNCATSTKTDIIYVSPMRANAPYETTKMYYSEKPYELSTYSYSQWAAIPTDMLSQAIEKKLVTSCLYKNVVHNNVLADANYRLITQLVTLRQDLTGQNTARNQLIIYVQLLDLNSNKVIGSMPFDEELTSDVGPQAMVNSLNQLVTKFNNDLVAWLKQRS